MVNSKCILEIITDTQRFPKPMIFYYQLHAYEQASMKFEANKKIICKTRQNLMQGVGDMPPLPPQHLLSGVLQMMNPNPKYDQFH